MTKKYLTSFIKSKLATTKTWALKALVVVYNNQTITEQSTERTVLLNGVGFSGVDAEILTSFAKQYITKKYLSDKQMSIVYKKIPKYWQQILDVSDVPKLTRIVLSEKNPEQLQIQLEYSSGEE